MAHESVIDVGDTPELLRLAEQVKASNQPAVLSHHDEPLAVITPIPKERADIWAGYDPERARAALRASAGALRGVDRDELLADIRAQRGQKRRRRR